MNGEWISNGKIYQKIERKVETILSQYGFSFACEGLAIEKIKYYQKEVSNIKDKSFGFILSTQDIKPEIQISEWIAMFQDILEVLSIKEGIHIKYQPFLEEIPSLVGAYSLKPSINLESEDLALESLAHFSISSKLILGEIFYNQSKSILSFRLNLTPYILEQSQMMKDTRTMILSHFSYHKLGVKLSQYYRKEGMEIVTQFFEKELVLKDWIEYAKKNGIGGLFLIDNLIHIKVINIQTPDTFQEVDISQFTF